MTIKFHVLHSFPVRRHLRVVERSKGYAPRRAESSWCACMVAALIVPSVTTLAGGLPGGDPH